MARYCSFYQDDPYTPCMNFAVKGKYRCAEHIQHKPGRRGDMSSSARAAAMKKNDGKCVQCGQEATEVNHIVPFHTFPEDEKWKANMPSNLEPLCLKHHAVITAKQRKDMIVLDDPDDRSTSARNRKNKRMRKKGFYI